ncbi:hypothetical protein BaRGS_00009823 [Batillaria attramentaria]|uniref:Uncharacterized protein n=1 Tax=Batillaria attramentaria TaxID=370345 RepID=A0ABD0LJ70_9CAEN
MEKTKRARKANFKHGRSTSAPGRNADGVRLRCVAASVPPITRDSKTEVWQRITEKVNSCGVALRDYPRSERKMACTERFCAEQKEGRKRRWEKGQHQRQFRFEEILLIIVGKIKLVFGA